MRKQVDADHWLPPVHCVRLPPICKVVVSEIADYFGGVFFVVEREGNEDQRNFVLVYCYFTKSLNRITRYPNWTGKRSEQYPLTLGERKHVLQMFLAKGFAQVC